MGNTKGNLRTLEAFALRNYKEGSVFYTTKEDKDITAAASYEVVKVKTERMAAIPQLNLDRVEKITKVTILWRNKN